MKHCQCIQLANSNQFVGWAFESIDTENILNLVTTFISILLSLLSDKYRTV